MGHLGDKETQFGHKMVSVDGDGEPFQDSVHVRISQAGKLACDKITCYLNRLIVGSSRSGRDEMMAIPVVPYKSQGISGFPLSPYHVNQPPFLDCV